MTTDTKTPPVVTTLSSPPKKRKRGRPPVGKGNGKKLGPMSSYHREKISKSQVLNRLIKHAEGRLSPAGTNGNQEMSATQVSAAVALLDRVLPKLSATEIKADVESTATVNRIEIVSVEPDKKPDVTDIDLDPVDEG